MKFIERADWDSDFFGFEIGRFLIDETRYFNAQQFSEEAQRFKLVYVFSKKELNYNNFKLVDKKVIFYQPIYNYITNQTYRNEIQSFNIACHNIEELINLSLQSGIYSRFYLDSNFINNEYTRLYKEWILNSVNGKLAFDVIVALKAEKIIGLATISKKTETLSDIGLIAVDKEFRGHGVASELLNKAIERVKSKSFSEIQVVTQLDNVAATKLYAKTNFLIKEITYIYHYWNL